MSEITHTIRRIARNRAIDLLSAKSAYIDHQRYYLSLPAIHFPYFHGIPHTDFGRFRELLARLSETHTFISYSEAVKRVQSGIIDRPYAAFSFDDGFLSNIKAAQILEEFGSTGMFFVPTNAIGLKDVFAARNFYGFDYGCDEGVMTWNHLENLVQRGHEVGNHTVNHLTVSNLSQDELTNEIGLAREALSSRLGACDHFAWPNGRFTHFQANAISTVFDTGHTSCASAERGAHAVVHETDINKLCIRREHLMPSWPLHHNMYFITKSARNASVTANEWPSAFLSDKH